MADSSWAFKSACKPNLITWWENENPSFLVCYHHAQATEVFVKSALYSLSWQVTSKWVALRKWGTWKMMCAEQQSCTVLVTSIIWPCWLKINTLWMWGIFVSVPLSFHFTPCKACEYSLIHASCWSLRSLDSWQNFWTIPVWETLWCDCLDSSMVTLVATNFIAKLIYSNWVFCE